MLITFTCHMCSTDVLDVNLIEEKKNRIKNNLFDEKPTTIHDKTNEITAGVIKLTGKIY